MPFFRYLQPIDIFSVNEYSMGEIVWWEWHEVRHKKNTIKHGSRSACISLTIKMGFHCFHTRPSMNYWNAISLDIDCLSRLGTRVWSICLMLYNIHFEAFCIDKVHVYFILAGIGVAVEYLLTWRNLLRYILMAVEILWCRRLF